MSFFQKIKKAGKLLLILRGLKRVKRIRKANGDASVKVGDKEVKDNPTTNKIYIVGKEVVKVDGEGRASTIFP